MAPKVGVKRSAPGKENEPPRTAKKTKTSASAAKKTPAANKAKASDSDAASTPAEPDRLPRGNAERLAQSQSAPSTNPRGLGRIHLPSDTISRLDDSWASAAYIMDFRTVAPVRAYYAQRPGQARPPDTRAVIDSWHAARSSCFQLKDPSLGLESRSINKFLRLDKGRALDVAAEPTILQKAALSRTIPPSVIGPDAIRPVEITVISMLWHCVQFMQATARDFPKSRITAQELHLDVWEVFGAMIVLLTFTNKAKDASTFRKHWMPRWDREEAALPVSKMSLTRRHGPTDEAEDAGQAGQAPPITVTQVPAHFEMDLELPVQLMGIPFPARQRQEFLEKVVRKLAQASACWDQASSVKLQAFKAPPAPSMRHLNTVQDGLLRQDDWFRDCVVYESPIEKLATFDKSAAISAMGEATMGSVLGDQAQREAKEATSPDAVPGETAVIPTSIPEVMAGGSETILTMEFAARRVGMTLEENQPVLDLQPVGPRTKVQPWQTIGIDWMLMQEHRKFPGGILADDCGLGKTFTALCLIYFQAIKEAEASPEGPFYPSLIVVPPSLLETGWHPEIKERFGSALNLRIFYRDTRITSNQAGKDLIINNIQDLQQWYKDLDHTSVETARTIVLTSYETWAKRTTKEVPKDEDLQAPDIPPGASAQNDIAIENELSRPDDPLGDETDETEESPRREQTSRRKKVITEIPELEWRRVICDEAQRIRNPLTTFFQSVVQLKTNTHWFLTATPMWNRALDVYGYLLMFTKNLTHAEEEALSDLTNVPVPTTFHLDPQGPLSDWGDIYGAWGQAQLPNDQALWPWALMHPKNLRRFTEDSKLDTEGAFVALPIIFQMCQLKRRIGEEVALESGLSIRIGADIPACHIHTIDLRFTPTDQGYHDSVYRVLAKRLYTFGQGQGEGGQGGKGGKGGSLINWGILRMLSFLGFSRRFFKFFSSEAVGRLDEEALHELIAAPDRGFCLFWHATQPDKAITMPSRADQRAWYIAHDCPALRYFLTLLKDHGIFDAGMDKPKPKMLLFCQWPGVAWLIEMFLVNLGLGYERILALDSQTERSAAIRRFNDESSRSLFLLSTFNVAAAGLNLQRACHIEVHFQSAMNLNQTAQAIGRVNRFGQPEVQHIYMLNNLHTVSRWLDQMAAEKFYPQLAAFWAKEIENEWQEWKGESTREEAIMAITAGLVNGYLGLDDGNRVRRQMKSVQDIGLKKGISVIPARNRLTRTQPGYQEELSNDQDVEGSEDVESEQDAEGSEGEQDVEGSGGE